MWVIEDRNFIIIDPAMWVELRVPWGLQTYLAAVQWVPHTFLGRPPYGTCTRDGVLRIPSGIYRETEHLLRKQMRSLRGVQNLRRRWSHVVANLREICLSVEMYLTRRETPPGRLVGCLFHSLVLAKSFMAFNWLLEIDHLTEEVASKVDIPPEGVQALLLSCSVPECLPHYVELELALLEFASSNMSHDEAAQIAWEYGFLEGFPIIPQPLEDPDRVLEYGIRLHDERGDEEVLRMIAELRASLEQSRCRLMLARSTLLVRAFRRFRQTIRALLYALQLAATEEEERHRWEMRAVRDFRILAELKGMNPTDIIEEDVLNAYHAPKITPRGWYKKERWKIIAACLPPLSQEYPATGDR